MHLVFPHREPARKMLHAIKTVEKAVGGIAGFDMETVFSRGENL
jgi:hypothetical protein